MIHAPLVRLIVAGAAVAAFSVGPAASAKPPTNWDGLTQIRSKNVDLLYLRPGVDFRQYKAIVLDPTEVAFKKDWHKDINQSRRGTARYSEADVRRVIDEAQVKLRGTFEKRFRETGFQIVPAPAENALRVFVGVANVNVTAPEMRSHGNSKIYSDQAGHATLVVEVRDSLSGELLGRAVDQDAAGDNFVGLRTSTSNWADFEDLFDRWARISAKGFQKLISSPPQPAQ